MSIQFWSITSFKYIIFLIKSHNLPAHLSVIYKHHKKRDHIMQTIHRISSHSTKFIAGNTVTLQNVWDSFLLSFKFGPKPTSFILFFVWESWVMKDKLFNNKRINSAKLFDLKTCNGIFEVMSTFYCLLYYLRKNFFWLFWVLKDLVELRKFFMTL